MAEDLKLGDDDVKEVEVEAGEGYVEFTSTMEYITAASYAWDMIQEIDTAILNKSNEKRVNRMKRQALRIMSTCLNELYEELFDDNNDSSDSTDD